MLECMQEIQKTLLWRGFWFVLVGFVFFLLLPAFLRSVTRECSAYLKQLKLGSRHI